MAEQLQEGWQEREDVAREEQDKDREKGGDQANKKFPQSKEPGTDQREALAKLSEIETAAPSRMAPYNTALAEGQLAAAGSALWAATAREGAGKALQQAKREKAAKELEQFEEPQLDRKEQKGAEEKLKQVAKERGDVGLGQFSGAVSAFAESLKGGKGKGSKASQMQAREGKIGELRDTARSGYKNRYQKRIILSLCPWICIGR